MEAALALFHQPVPAHRPVRGRYQRCSVGDPGGRAGAVVGFGHAVSAGQGLGKR